MEERSALSAWEGSPDLSLSRFGRWDLAAMAFLTLVTLLFHWPLITPDLSRRQSYPDGDFYDQFHAFAFYEHDRLWAGEIPLWNPYTFGGHPFLADVQAAVFYPPSLLAMLFSGPGPFSPLWLELEAIAHFCLAALSTYLFVRWRLGANRHSPLATRHSQGVRGIVGPLLSALTFAFGGYLTSYPPLQLAILETQAWLPLILLLLDVGLSMRSWPFVVGAGAAWGMALLAGHPQSAMYVLYGVFSYGLYRSWRERLPWRWAAAAHLAWIGIGFGLAAVHLLPAWEFMRLSVRARASYEELASGFGWRDLAQYLFPGAFTHWSPVYVGILPLCLAALACGQALAAYVRREGREAPEDGGLEQERKRREGREAPEDGGLEQERKRREGREAPEDGGLEQERKRKEGREAPEDGGLEQERKRREGREAPSTSHSLLPTPYSLLPTPGSDVLFWAVMALGSLILSMGGKAFFYRLFYWLVPGFNLFRSQERAIYLTSFALAVLAGYGWEGGTGIAIKRLPRSQPGGGEQTSRFTLHASRFTFHVSRFTHHCLVHTGWAALSVALVMVDLGVANMGANLSPGDARSHVYDGSWLAPVLGDERMSRAGLVGAAPARIANEWGLPGNGGCWLRLQDLYGASPLRLQAHKTMADVLPHWRLWQLFGVRYVATWEHDLPGPLEARRVAMRGQEWAKNTVYVHRLQGDALHRTETPRAWVVHRAQQADDGQALARLADPAFDPFAQVLLADPVPPGFASNEPSRPAEVVVHYVPEAIAVQADLSAPGWLVLGEWDYPGWQAWVDGVRQGIYRADYGLRAVPLAEGQHRVEFRYRPASFYLGSAVSALTLLTLVGGFIGRTAGCWRSNVGAGRDAERSFV